MIKTGAVKELFTAKTCLRQAGLCGEKQIILKLGQLGLKSWVIGEVIKGKKEVEII